ncbi:uncharacterized protein LOC120669850 isoform X1 [Panicum virgatum]|uniref:uncharacterized protein LOC120669850 isoform X1 n=1 Tax=Panicum virgatum TaxID=38727 RepID=UPI0019D50A41|nr:uncharacterized protein LOC120669850 isoform X1 [Panicum virgatum]
MPTCNLKYCENWCPSLSNGHNIDSYCCCIGRPTACASSLWWVWLLVPGAPGRHLRLQPLAEARRGRLRERLQGRNPAARRACGRHGGRHQEAQSQRPSGFAKTLSHRAR